MTFRVSVLATGSEILDGRVVDTNSNYIAKEIASLGLTLTRITTVTDDKQELLEALAQLSAVSDCIITSGGLGPTTDDLTRDVVATFCKVPLKEHPKARSNIEDFFARRGRVIDEQNYVQALIPSGATVIYNEHGTAPGFIATTKSGVSICALSGVPRELTTMFQSAVLPLIKKQSVDAKPIRTCVLKTFGLPESLVGSRVKSVNPQQNVSISYRAAFREVHVTLKAPEEVNVTDTLQAIRSAIGPDFIYSTDNSETLPLVASQLLQAHGATVATAESCTGGLLSGYLTENSGASNIFEGGIVSYSNSAKKKLLSVSQDTLTTCGAVSAETVQSMSESVRSTMGATYGIAISGVAGPSGGTKEKPVGTVFIALAGPDETIVRKCFYPNSRDIIRRYVSFVALDILRRVILKLPIPTTYPVADTK
jgi:nicotinamide-nucleotide amidase